MARILYVGDEVTAAGFRLAGADTRIATASDAADALREALESDADCLLFSGRLVDAVPATVLEDALRRVEPMFAVVPDILGRGSPGDLARDVRAALGLEA